jgi:hypothetical protein
MGLHLNYELRLPGCFAAEQVTAVLAKLHAFAVRAPFEHVSELYDRPTDGLRRLAKVHAATYKDENPDLIADIDSVQGFSVQPGRGCESAVLAFVRRSDHRGHSHDWFWHWSCKTQYASVFGDRHLVACHTGLVGLLDHARSIGVGIEVRDETHYWQTRDEGLLIAEVDAMNRIVARIAGKLSDVHPRGVDVRAPIFRHDQFEHLEMNDDD